MEKSTGKERIQKADPVFGDLEGEPEMDLQEFDDSCAIRCQEVIIEKFTGQSVDEKELMQISLEQGWIHTSDDPDEVGGTAPEDVGNLLEMYNIPVNRYDHANIFHLTNELAQGHKVMIGVDSHELHYGDEVLEEIEETLDVGEADHVVIVSGIDTEDLENITVTVSDPGTGETAAKYPINKFLSSWSESNYFMVATQEPPPEEHQLPEMQNFDYEKGHISEVLNMPYDEFLAYENRLDDLKEHIGHMQELESDSDDLDSVLEEIDEDEYDEFETEFEDDLDMLRDYDEDEEEDSEDDKYDDDAELS